MRLDLKPGPSRDATRPYSRAHRDNPKPKTANILLPTENDMAPPPPPAGFRFTPDEQEAFDDLFGTGESTMWSDADHTSVAVLVKIMTKIQNGTASAPMVAEYRHLAESLGLTPAGRARLGWEVAGESA